MPAKVSSSSAVPTEHGVGAVGAEESFVYQLNGTGELVQAEGSPGAATLPLHSGDMTLIEVILVNCHALSDPALRHRTK